MYLKCILMLGKYIIIYGSCVVRMYNHFHIFYDSRTIENDLVYDEPNFVIILTATLLQ
jgi:hypothetical protein